MWLGEEQAYEEGKRMASFRNEILGKREGERTWLETVVFVKALWGILL